MQGASTHTPWGPAVGGRASHPVSGWVTGAHSGQEGGRGEEGSWGDPGASGSTWKGEKGQQGREIKGQVSRLLCP